MGIMASRLLPFWHAFHCRRALHIACSALLFATNNFCPGLFQLPQLRHILHSLMREDHPSVPGLRNQLIEHPTDKFDSRSRLLRLSAPPSHAPVDVRLTHSFPTFVRRFFIWNISLESAHHLSTKLHLVCPKSHTTRLKRRVTSPLSTSLIACPPFCLMQWLIHPRLHWK